MASTRPRSRRIFMDRFTEPEFEPYVKAIGQLAPAWNSLHETFAQTVAIMLTGNRRDTFDDKAPQVRGAWYS